MKIGVFCLALFLVLIGLITSIVLVRSEMSVTKQDHNAFVEDLSALNTKWSQEWDRRREDASNEAHRDEMRQEWRKAYSAEVRELYSRHGKQPPQWAED